MLVSRRAAGPSVSQTAAGLLGFLTTSRPSRGESKSTDKKKAFDDVRGQRSEWSETTARQQELTGARGGDEHAHADAAPPRSHAGSEETQINAKC